MLVDPALRRQPQPPRTEGGESCVGEIGQQVLARGASRIDAQVERCPLQQRRPLVLTDHGRQFVVEPAGNDRLLHAILGFDNRLGTARLSEQSLKLRLAIDKTENCGSA